MGKDGRIQAELRDDAASSLNTEDKGIDKETV